MSIKNVKIKDGEEYMTLNVLLKIADIIETGGAAKWFLKENEVYVNDTLEDRRGRKLYPGDTVKVLNKIFQIVK